MQIVGDGRKKKAMGKKEILATEDKPLGKMLGEKIFWRIKEPFVELKKKSLHQKLRDNSDQ